MKDYIERAAIIERLQKVQMDGYGFSQGVQFGVDHAITCIKETHAADVVEVRHGRWMDAESDDGCTVWHCSACSCPVKTIGGYPIYRHCPMCGVRMDKEDEP